MDNVIAILALLIAGLLALRGLREPRSSTEYLLMRVPIERPRLRRGWLLVLTLILIGLAVTRLLIGS